MGSVAEGAGELVILRITRMLSIRSGRGLSTLTFDPVSLPQSLRMSLGIENGRSLGGRTSCGGRWGLGEESASSTTEASLFCWYWRMRWFRISACLATLLFSSSSSFLFCSCSLIFSTRFCSRFCSSCGGVVRRGRGGEGRGRGEKQQCHNLEF